MTFTLSRLLLLLYGSFLFVSYWQPFLLVKDLPALLENIRQSFSLPFEVMQRTPYAQTIENLFRDFLFFVPLGYFFGLSVPKKLSRSYSITRKTYSIVLVLFAVCFLIELGQLVLASRVFDVVDVFVYLAGAYSGVVLARELPHLVHESF